MVKFTYINTVGEVVSTTPAVEPGTTVAEFLNGSYAPEAMKIRVNHAPCQEQGAYVIQEGDRIVVTPTNMKGRDVLGS